MIKAGIVESLRRKFIDSNNKPFTPASGRNSTCFAVEQHAKKTKFSDSSDLSTVSHASVTIEKHNDESKELKILNPLAFNKTEIKKVTPTRCQNNRLKSIERSLSTSAHIDDTYRLVKQSLVSYFSIYFEWQIIVLILTYSIVSIYGYVFKKKYNKIFIFFIF